MPTNSIGPYGLLWTVLWTAALVIGVGMAAWLVRKIERLTNLVAWSNFTQVILPNQRFLLGRRNFRRLLLETRELYSPAIRRYIDDLLLADTDTEKDDKQVSS